MRRRLFNVAAFVSLLLALASAAAWVICLFCSVDCIVNVPRFGTLVPGLGAGRVGVEAQWIDDAPPQWAMESHSLPAMGYSEFGAKGFSENLRGVSRGGLVILYSGDATVIEIVCFLPLWFLLLASIALPAWWAWRCRVDRYRSRVRRLLFSCPKCGYDLRASKNTCPECGEAIPAQPPLTEVKA